MVKNVMRLMLLLGFIMNMVIAGVASWKGMVDREQLAVLWAILLTLLAREVWR